MLSTVERTRLRLKVECQQVCEWPSNTLCWQCASVVVNTQHWLLVDHDAVIEILLQHGAIYDDVKLSLVR